ncbi:ShlB/FhaC/HecB family hemolysin secretion/activation protein [Ruegeria arenilitoris]|uniref:ShlB/FhaC/HecB family hemolysin secretion/activation protein n=1 Tax=Ruegeria arenilitoris TaxID=1173585 RepID=UPI00147EF2FA|nr:ShlB/FhaC/HecB family hemolysin secretion/activation protein [Ruegeria arenilitoris]
MPVTNSVVIAIICTFLAIVSVPKYSMAQTWDIASQHSVSGVTVYDTDELLTFAGQLAFDRSGRITAADVASTITQIYREDGYFLAEAWPGPDGQSIVVDEGRIQTIEIEGVDTRTFQTLEKIFRPLTTAYPITLKQFERAVMLAEDIPDLDVSTELDYPDQAGARLRVLGEPLRKQAGSATLDNPPRELGEALSFYVVQEFYSTLTVGDLLRFEGSGNYNWDKDDEHSLWGAVTYRTPLNSDGLYGEVFYGNINAKRDLSGEFARTDVDGENFTVALGYPVIRDVAHYGYLLLDYRLSEADSVSGGVPLSSDAGVVGLTYLYGQNYPKGQTLEAGLTLSFGNNNTTDANFDDGDSSFWHLRGGIGYESPLTSLSPNTAWRTEIWGQFTTDRLPSVEEYFLGDRYALRGYRFDEVDGDSGISAIFEVSHSYFPRSQSIHRLTPFAFFDVGYISNNDPASFEVESATLASTGLGLDIEFKQNLFLSGYVGVPLRDGPLTDSGDPGAYLALTTSW